MHRLTLTAMDLPLPASMPPRERSAGAAPDQALAVAFGELATDYYERVFQFLARQVRQRHEAEDLTQRTFIRAFRAFPRFDRARPFAPWIFTIARRELIDYYRRLRPETAELEEAHAVSRAAPDRAAEQEDAAARVWELAEALPPKQRQALLLHYGEGFSLPEVAAIMNLTHVHAKVLVFRARQRLRRAWGEETREMDR